MFDLVVSENPICRQSVAPACHKRVATGRIVTGLERERQKRLDQVQVRCV
jgi:hypothetical protein